MIFQVFASIVLMLLVVYAFLQARSTRAVAALVLVMAALGEYLVLVPDAANTIAHHVGIGRGADLAFYLWGLVSAIVFLNLHLKFRLINERYIALVRAIAIAEARQKMRDATRGH